MIIEIVNAADKINGIICPKKVTGLINITSYYTYHIIHLKLVSWVWLTLWNTLIELLRTGTWEPLFQSLTNQKFVLILLDVFKGTT